MDGHSTTAGQLSRRAFLTGTMSLLVVTEAFAVEGVQGPAALHEAVLAMRGVVVASGSGPTIHVLATPGCDKASRMSGLVRSHAGSSFRIVPHSPIPGDDGVVGGAIAGGAKAVERLLAGFRDDGGDEVVGASQRIAFESKVAAALARATGRTPASPTMVIGTNEGCRVFRGLPSDLDMNRITTYLSGLRKAYPWRSNPELFDIQG